MIFFKKNVLALFVATGLLLGCSDDNGSSANAEESSVEKTALSSSVVPDNGSRDIFFGDSLAQNLGDFSTVNKCYKEGMATITVMMAEKIKYTCPNNATIYNASTECFYHCEGDTLVETYMPPCGE